MTNIATHPHAAFDRFPQLLDSLAAEFGSESLIAIAERVIAAEFADFHWEGRFAEMNLGSCERLDADDATFTQVAIAGYFRGRYYVATCAVDAARRIDRLLTLHHVESLDAAVAWLGTHPA